MLQSKHIEKHLLVRTCWTYFWLQVTLGVTVCLALTLIEMLDLSHELMLLLIVHHPYDHYLNPWKNHSLQKTLSVIVCLTLTLIGMLDFFHELVLVLNLHHPQNHLMRTTLHFMMKHLYQKLFYHHHLDVQNNRPLKSWNQKQQTIGAYLRDH